MFPTSKSSPVYYNFHPCSPFRYTKRNKIIYCGEIDDQLYYNLFRSPCCCPVEFGTKKKVGVTRPNSVKLPQLLNP